MATYKRVRCPRGDLDEVRAFTLTGARNKLLNHVMEAHRTNPFCPFCGKPMAKLRVHLFERCTAVDDAITPAEAPA